MARHYLDYASTAPLRPVALQAMVEALGLPAGDPSRIHTEASTIRQLLELGRQSVADFVGCRSREVLFTSSATEGILSTVWGAAQAGGSIVATRVEHSAVLDSAERSSDVVYVDVDQDGIVDPDDVGRAIDRIRAAGGQVALVACQWVNHEVGMVQPIQAVIAAAKERDVKVMVDASQAVGRLQFNFETCGADVVVFSGHKLGGPAGTGVVLLRRGIRFPPLLVGGSQERARRAGFENSAGAVALGAACAELVDTAADEHDRCVAWSQSVRDGLRQVDGISLHGPAESTKMAPHIVCASIAGIEPQAVLIGLDQAGIAVHSGSACASEDIQPSPVLQAMGLDAHRSLRISTGWETVVEDIDAFLEAFPAVVAKLRALR